MQHARFAVIQANPVTTRSIQRRGGYEEIPYVDDEGFGPELPRCGSRLLDH